MAKNKSDVKQLLVSSNYDDLDLLAVKNRAELLALLKAGRKKVFLRNYFSIKLFDLPSKGFKEFLSDDNNPDFEDPDIPESTIREIVKNDLNLEKLLSYQGPQNFMVNVRKKTDQSRQETAGYKDRKEVKQVYILKLVHAENLVGILCVASNEVEQGYGFVKNNLFFVSQLPAVMEMIISRETIALMYKQKDVIPSLVAKLSDIRDENDLIQYIENQLRERLGVNNILIHTYNVQNQTVQNFDATDTGSLYPQSGDRLIKEYTVYNGIHDRALVSDKPVIIHLGKNSLESSTELLGFRKAPDTIEMISIKLSCHNRIIGFLTCLSETTHYFDFGHMFLIESIAPQIALTLYRIQLSKSIRKNYGEKQILISLNNEISAVKEEGQLLKVIKTHLRMLFNFSDIAISVLVEQPGYQRILLAEPTDKRREHEGYENLLLDYYPATDGVFDQTLASKRSIIFDMKEIMKRKLIPDYLRWADGSGVKEFAAVALHNGDKKIGVFYVSSELEAYFNAGHLRIIESIASRLAAIVDGILINIDIVQKQREQATLLSLSNELASVRNKNDLFALINTKIKQLYQFAEVTINVEDEDRVYHRTFLSEDTEFNLKYPGSKKLAELRFSVADGVYSVIAASDQAVIYDLEKQYKYFQGIAYINFWIDQDMKELIGLPLKVGNRIIGVFFLYTKEKGTFLKRQLGFLQGICYQIAIVMDNVLANDRLILREQEKSVLLSISNDMTSVRTKNDLYEIVNTKLCNISLFGELVISLINEDKITRSAYIYRSMTPGLFHDHPGFEQASIEKYPIKDGIMDVALQSGSHLILDMDELIKRENGPSYVPFWHSYGMREMVGLPLRAGNEDIGILWVYLKTKGTLNNFHLTLLRGVSSQIAIALVNIQANDRITSQLDEISKYRQQLEEENSYLVKEIAGKFDYKDIIGKAGSMQTVFNMVNKVANSNSTVLVLGETGTGKELIARAIQSMSTRNKNIMIKLNCAALPASLIESELFGHEKGSFTGASEKRIGKFELANKGTLFLDEVGEMPLELQVKLLRVLQEREIERIGGSSVIPVDVRIIAATNRNLEREVAEGRFRADLYYRLNIFPITVPALRDRKEDIPVLAAHFINRYSKLTGKNIINISKKIEKDLVAYDWPGNVRELEHLIERSVLLNNGNTLRDVLLPTSRANDGSSETLKSNTAINSLEENEREHILLALKNSKGKISGRGGAAEILNINVSTLNARMRKLKITKDHIFKIE
jgi:formate hydrogenlyase transcriptional activator